MSKICPKCGAKLEDDVFACEKCGEVLTMDMGPAPLNVPPVPGPLPGCAIPDEARNKNKE